MFSAAERVLGDAAVHFERSDCRDQHRRRRLQSRLSALDVEEFLGAEIGAEARFGDDVVGELERRPGRDHRVAAVGDVGERAAVHERGRTFEGLHEIGPERALEQRGHRAGRVEVGRGDRAPVPARADHHPAELLLEIVEVGREAEGRHHLRGDRDVETVLARKPVAHAEPDHGLAQRPVVHVEDAPPGDPPLVEAERIAPIHVIVDHRREKIVGRSLWRENRR